MKNGFIIFILLFVAVFLFMFGIYLYGQIYYEKRGFKKRLEVIESEGEERIGEKDTPSEENRFRHFLGSLGKFLAPKKEGNISDMRKLFVRAGYRNQGALPLFFGLKVFLALLFFGATLMGKLLFWEWMAPDSFAYISIILAIVGFYLPNLWIKLRSFSRKDKIQRGLPDALDLMVVCVEAGSGMDAALNRTAEEMKKTNSILAEELSLVNLEIRAGKSKQEALKSLA